MKYSFLSAVALMLVVAFPAQALEIGKPAPDFKMKNIQDKFETLSQYKGRIVVLEWTNPGCPFVHKHYDKRNMQNLQHYAVSKGVEWISINSSAQNKEGYLEAEGAKESVLEHKALASAYILDHKGTLGHLYGAKATPHMFVIDKDGNLAYEGAIDDKPTPDINDNATAHNYVKAAIDELLAGKPVTTPQTRAYGCSVKYAE
jgi:peroxiredoxin